jgi:multiple sugar transport system ATP-binding protein
MAVDGVGPVKVRVEGEFGLRHGEKAYLTPDPAKIHRFDAHGMALG